MGQQSEGIRPKKDGIYLLERYLRNGDLLEVHRNIEDPEDILFFGTFIVKHPNGTTIPRAFPILGVDTVVDAFAKYQPEGELAIKEFEIAISKPQLVEASKLPTTPMGRGGIHRIK